MLQRHLGICLKVQKEKTQFPEFLPGLTCSAARTVSVSPEVNKPQTAGWALCWIYSNYMALIFNIQNLWFVHRPMILEKPLHLFPSVLAAPIRIPFSLGICLPVSRTPSSEPLHWELEGCWGAPGSAPHIGTKQDPVGHKSLSVSHIACLQEIGFIQFPWPFLSSNGQVQTLTN